MILCNRCFGCLLLFMGQMKVEEMKFMNYCFYHAIPPFAALDKQL